MFGGDSGKERASAPHTAKHKKGPVHKRTGAAGSPQKGRRYEQGQKGPGRGEEGKTRRPKRRASYPQRYRTPGKKGVQAPAPVPKKLLQTGNLNEHIQLLGDGRGFPSPL
ncbi:hypothetical protein TNIN_34091 [Trichonephila inaurata madagascariensis]|uniref:Uncharacterized protein n=1 Tax=Trichonephila inaurata madagascariensis TaxID=2747483 RepID=A0A8X6XSF6_9ARAC|nr:hypothetical protein TNIN_34091 [Trichonephila inaurata madagascariensis]